jgi:hypothetical protein
MRFTRLAITPLLVASILAACQGAPVKLLSDPKEILAAAATSTAAATSVHVDLTAEGKLGLDPLGTGTATPVDLSGSTANADLDLQDGKLHASFSAPSLFNLAGDVIVADAQYIKTTLTGPKYRSTPLSGERQQPIKGLTDLLARSDLQPTKGADAPCAGGTCYTLTLALKPGDLAPAASGAGGAIPSALPVPVQLPDLSNSTVDVTLHVDQATNRVSDATAVVDMGDLGKLTVQGTFTKWNEPVRIDPPPADQVEPAG